MTRTLLAPFLRSLHRVQVISQHIRMSSAAASDDAVILERKNNCGVITLNRPRVLNTLNLPMVRTIYPQVKEWDNDPNMKMVIIKGTGDKAFCAGGDIVAVVKANLAKEKELGQQFFKEEYVLNHLIGTLHIPWVALIDGITMGGGVGLSVHGQFRVATERTLFAMPETAIGLFPDVGGGYFLPRLSGKLGMYLALTGFRLKGRDVLHAGVATHFVESSKIPELEESLLSLTNASSDGIGKLLGKFQRQSTLDADKPFILQPHLEAIDRLFNGTTIEEIFAKLGQEDTDWSNKQLEILHKMSPTSLKVTLRQILTGETMSLKEDLAMEYRLTQRCCVDNDLQEGVRAVIIDKDHKPAWNPSKLNAVTDHKLDWYFSHLPEERELKL